MEARQLKLLQIAFMAGAITDAVAVLPMLFPQVAEFLWGFRDPSGSYRFAMGYGISLMIGWTALLFWAYKSPLERRFVAALTIVVICGLIVTEAIAVQSGVLQASRMIPTWCLQVILLALFGSAYGCSSAQWRTPFMTMNKSGWIHYVWSCGLLTLPIFVWNIVFIGFLPPALGTNEFWRDIPPFVAFGENSLRFAIFVLPFLMPLEVTTVEQRKGLMLFVLGTVLYFLSWVALMLFPQSGWSESWLGFLAPSYTPIIWLFGLGLIGRRLYWNFPYRWWIYEALVCGFTGFHIVHTSIVYARNH
jgi:hypothetical protein